MTTPSKSTDIVAFTKEANFYRLGDSTTYFPYQRVTALWRNDGVFGQSVGENDTRGHKERVLTVSPEVGSRLMSCFTAITSSQEVNCHRFSRKISGMPDSSSEPTLNFDDLPIASQLPTGSMGIIGVQGYGVPHSIGYGMGNEGLQVMSPGGELGFVDNDVLVEFYRRLYPKHAVNLHVN